MRRAFFAFAVVLASGCAKVDYIEIEPNQVTLQRRGETVWLRAKPMSRNGVYFPRLAVSWTCNNPKAATIDSAGRVTAVGPGQVTCTASGGGQQATVDVDVNTVEVVKLDPATVSLTEDSPPVQPHVSALDEHGHELHGRTIDMRSKDESVANVDGEKIYPVAPGHTQVTVRADDRSAVVDVTVTKGKKQH
jgi:hypothetical protein